MNQDVLNIVYEDNVTEINSTDFKKSKCQVCGSINIGKEKPDTCIFCGSSNLTFVEDILKIRDLNIIPFQKTREDAVKDYKKKVFFNPIVPFCFKSKKTISNLRKVYLASNLYSVKLAGPVKFVAVDNEKAPNQKGKVEKKKYEVFFTANFDYRNLFSNNFSKIDDRLFREIVDYDGNGLRPYENGDLADSFLLLGDLNRDEAVNKIQNATMKNALSLMRDNVKHELKKVDSNNLGFSLTEEKNLLVPVYLLNVTYKGKNYVYLMNGVNGKSRIDLCFGIVELVLCALVLFAIFFAFSFLIVRFL